MNNNQEKNHLTKMLRSDRDIQIGRHSYKADVKCVPILKGKCEHSEKRNISYKKEPNVISI